MSFDHVAWRALPYSMGVEIGSDWQDKAPDDPIFGLYRTCGFWTKGETRLLMDVAFQAKGAWLEIGAHTGWCTNALVKPFDRYLGAGLVVAIEPMFSLPRWYRRFTENLAEYHDNGPMDGMVMPWAGRSDQYFAIWDGAGGRTFDGCLIDGDHCDVNPLNDAIGCYERLNERGVILLHDFRGPDIWNAGKYLADRGMQWRVYPSVHMVFVAWRGAFEPPPDIQEGDVDWAKHYGLPEWAQ